MKKKYITPRTTMIPFTPSRVLATSSDDIPVVPEDGSGSNVVDNSGGAWSTGRNKTEHPIWH
ncbi:MAG: hypothetical protein ACI3YC_07475 [Alloprevotella sp.]